jgi:uncharacterized cupin superfamily protein
MDRIKVEHNPDKEDLSRQGVFNWPVWTKEASEFPWKYDERETCYLLEGEVVVKPEDGEPVKIGKGGAIS